MKLKNGVVITAYGSEHIAVAAGEAAKSFNGMIKMNGTAAFICEILKNDTTVDEIVDALCEKYEVDREAALKSVQNTLETLRNVGLLEDE